MGVGDMAHCSLKTKHWRIKHSVKPSLVGLKIVWTQISLQKYAKANVGIG